MFRSITGQQSNRLILEGNCLHKLSFCLTRMQNWNGLPINKFGKHLFIHIKSSKLSNNYSFNIDNANDFQNDYLVVLFNQAIRSLTLDRMEHYSFSAYLIRTNPLSGPKAWIQIVPPTFNFRITASILTDVENIFWKIKSNDNKRSIQGILYVLKQSDQ